MKQIPIAVIGLGALFPGSIEKDGFWRNILDGRDLIDEVPPSHWLIDDYYDPDPGKAGKTYSRRGAFLSETPFDPLANGIPPTTLPSTDSAQLLALVVAKRVLEDACKLDFSHIDRARTSVILGVASATELAATMAESLQYPVWIRAMQEAGLREEEIASIASRANSSYAEWTENTFPGLLGNVVAGRIANRFNLGGANCVIDAACASSLAALRMAVQELTHGDSDMVVTGGVDALNDIFMYVCFSRTPAMSPSGDCRPFSTDADGTVLGEGLGMVALRRLDDAERDGDHVYAVLRGIGASSDGRSKSIYAPRPEGQTLALERAYEAAGYGPETVELMEAHGTGTIAGDAAEMQSLLSVFGAAERAERPWCALGSIKSQIGHTKGAAGAASLIKAILSLHHKVLPPTIKVDSPHGNLNVAGAPLYVNSRLRPWIRGKSHPRRASVSAFGFGGSNFHVTLEEYGGPAPRPQRVRHLPSELFLFSADAPDILRAKVITEVDTAKSADAFAYAAQRTQADFVSAAACRLAIVAANFEELSSQAARFAESVSRAPGTPFAERGLYYGLTPRSGKIAFLFPGQGSQYVNMGAELTTAFEIARKPWDDVAGAEESELRRVPLFVFPPPAFDDAERGRQDRDLMATEHAQPAIGVASLAYLELIEALGLQPDMAGGHSFGELTALAAAGALPKTMLPQIAAYRGRLMAGAAAGDTGAMLAVFAPREAIESFEAVRHGAIVIANHNGPRQIVVAGPITEVEALREAVSARGIENKRLPVSAAFHSPMMDSAAGPFEEFLCGIAFAHPKMSVYANATAQPYPSAQSIPALLARQISSPVLFQEQIETMYADGARIFIELGPGAALSQLVGQCLAERDHLAISFDGKIKDPVWRLWSGLGQLSAAGLKLDLRALWEQTALAPPSQESSSAATVGISGANFGKRYPWRDNDRKARPSYPRRVEAPLAANEPTPQNQSAGEVSASRDPFAGQGSYKPDSAVERTPAQKDAGVVSQAAEDRFAGGGHADLRLIETIIRHSSEAHQVAQKAMADAHLSYLKATELALLRLGGDNSSRAASALTSPQFGPAPFEPLQPAADILSAKADLRTARDDAADRMSNAPIHTAAPFWEQRQARQDLSPKADVPRHANSAAQGLKANDYSTLVLDVIAKKTGYPADMLKLEMELEADLGIDSIKRVEILSAFREAAPGVPAIDMSELAELRTIGSIIRRLGAAPSSSVDAPPSSEPEQASNETGGDQSTLSRLILELVNASSQKTPFAPSPRTVAIVDGYSDELPGALVRALERRGVAALRISAIEEAATIQSDMVIVLTGSSASNPSDAAARSFMAAKAYASRALSEGGWFVTVQDTGGDFGFTGRIPSHAWFGGCPGLVKTAAQEWPNVRVKAIDLEGGGRSNDVLADVLAAEILDGGSELEIGLDANGRRVTIREKERNVIQGALRRPSRLPDRPVFIVTGGARGVTSECMIALAKAMPCRLALFGRTQHVTTPLHLLGLDEEALKSAVLADIRTRGDDPPHLLRQVAAQSAAIQASQAIDATLQELRALGCEAIYESVDVANAADTSAAAGRVRQRWGQIDGFVHGAGQLKDKLIIHKVLDQFRSVFDTKVLGLKNLLDATQKDDLKLIVLFSSVAGRYGNSGQCDYAMANEVMNKVARAEAARRGDDCLVRSIDWGPWDGGMVTPALKRWFAERGISTIGLAQGAAAFVDELLYAGPEADQTEIILSARRREGDTPRPANAL